MKNAALNQILLSRHFIVKDTVTESPVNQAYFNAMLLTNYGIVLDKPEFVSPSVLSIVDELFHLNIPKSFYNNPQDTKYFSCEELIVEQVVSYFFYGSELGRVELFKKMLPQYVVGDELKLRTIYVLNSSEAEDKLREITAGFCAYTRPWGLAELEEFKCLFDNGYYAADTVINCKDNVLSVLDKDVSFARFLDKKDIVKLSVKTFGEVKDFKQFSRYQTKEIQRELNVIASYIPYVKHCPTSKKQAKYFNKIVKLCSVKNQPAMTNAQSPDRRANEFLKRGDVVGAAEIYAQSGSMLERRIKMLLSRANPVEAVKILDMLPASNPIVLYQTISNISADSEAARTFTFYHNNKVKVHRETEYEARWRKSRLNEGTRKLLKDTCVERIKDYYKSLPSVGTVAIDDNFYRIGLPTNTSAGGKGIDVLPTGSRIPVKADNIRTFVHWEHAFDIDSSLIVVSKDGTISAEGWFNYGSKPFGHDILFSGDITGSAGAEFFDVKLDKLKERGVKYVIQTFHGYMSKLNSGEIYAGYQVKSDLNTKAWDPKNIEFQFRVQGDSRACVAFAIDLDSMEVVILNQIMESDDRVVNPDGFKAIEKFLNPECLDINIGMIAECRGTKVAPEEANVVFSDTYTEVIPEGESPKQLIVRSWELEKLVAMVNA